MVLFPASLMHYTIPFESKEDRIVLAFDVIAKWLLQRIFEITPLVNGSIVWTIDNIDYDTDKLSDEAKAQLISIQFVDQELARLQAQTAAYQTARIGLRQSLAISTACRRYD